MGTLKIGWCPARGTFLGKSYACLLEVRGFKQAPGMVYWVIPREQALGLCEDLHKSGVALIWLGSLAYPGNKSPP